MQTFRPIRPRVGSTGIESFGNLLLTLAHRIPERVVRDAQMRSLGPDPLGFGVRARDALAGVGILDEAQAVPDQNTRIELVVEEAGASRPVASDAAVAPCAIERSGNALPVQIDGNGLRAFAGCKLAEDAAHITANGYTFTEAGKRFG